MSNRRIIKIRKKTDPNVLAAYKFNGVDATPQGEEGPELEIKGVIADAARNPKLKKAVRRKYQRLFDTLNLRAQREQQRIIDMKQVNDNEEVLYDDLDKVEFDYNHEVTLLNARMIADLFPKYVIREWNVVDENGTPVPYDDDAKEEMTSVLEQIDIEDLLLFAEFFRNRDNFQMEHPLTKEEGIALGEGYGI